MVTRLFKKPDVDDQKRAKKLREDIYTLSKEYEALEGLYSSKEAKMREDFIGKSTKLESVIRGLEEILSKKRAERKVLEAPLTEKRRELNELEKELKARAEELIAHGEATADREKKADQKISDAQDLIDEYGEKETKLASRERMVSAREDGVAEKEMRYLADVETFNENKGKSDRELELREKNVHLRELNVESKLENITKREKALYDKERAVNDKILTLARSVKRLKNKP